MNYTDADVERVAKSIWAVLRKYETGWGSPEDAPFPDKNEPGAEEYFLSTGPAVHEMARAALEAMAREPLEDVLNDARIYDVYVLSVTLSDGTDAWEAQIMEPKRDRRWATGATIDEAIRRAVAAAKGDE